MPTYQNTPPVDAPDPLAAARARATNPYGTQSMSSSGSGSSAPQASAQDVSGVNRASGSFIPKPIIISLGDSQSSISPRRYKVTNATQGDYVQYGDNIILVGPGGYLTTTRVDRRGNIVGTGPVRSHDPLDYSEVGRSGSTSGSFGSGSRVNSLYAPSDPSLLGATGIKVSAQNSLTGGGLMNDTGIDTTRGALGVGAFGPAQNPILVQEGTSNTGAKVSVLNKNNQTYDDPLYFVRQRDMANREATRLATTGQANYNDLTGRNFLNQETNPFTNGSNIRNTGGFNGISLPDYGRNLELSSLSQKETPFDFLIVNAANNEEKTNRYVNKLFSNDNTVDIKELQYGTPSSAIKFGSNYLTRVISVPINFGTSVLFGAEAITGEIGARGYNAITGDLNANRKRNTGIVSDIIPKGSQFVKGIGNFFKPNSGALGDLTGNIILSKALPGESSVVEQRYAGLSTDLVGEYRSVGSQVTKFLGDAKFDSPGSARQALTITATEEVLPFTSKADFLQRQASVPDYIVADIKTNSGVRTDTGGAGVLADLTSRKVVFQNSFRQNIGPEINTIPGKFFDTPRGEPAFGFPFSDIPRLTQPVRLPKVIDVPQLNPIDLKVLSNDEFFAQQGLFKESQANVAGRVAEGIKNPQPLIDSNNFFEKFTGTVQRPAQLKQFTFDQTITPQDIFERTPVIKFQEGVNIGTALKEQVLPPENSFGAVFSDANNGRSIFLNEKDFTGVRGFFNKELERDVIAHETGHLFDITFLEKDVKKETTPGISSKNIYSSIRDVPFLRDEAINLQKKGLIGDDDFFKSYALKERPKELFAELYKARQRKPSLFAENAPTINKIFSRLDEKFTSKVSVTINDADLYGGSSNPFDRYQGTSGVGKELPSPRILKTRRLSDVETELANVQGKNFVGRRVTTKNFFTFPDRSGIPSFEFFQEGQGKTATALFRPRDTLLPKVSAAGKVPKVLDTFKYGRGNVNPAKSYYEVITGGKKINVRSGLSGKIVRQDIVGGERNFVELDNPSFASLVDQQVSNEAQRSRILASAKKSVKPSSYAAKSNGQILFQEQTAKVNAVVNDFVVGETGNPVLDVSLRQGSRRGFAPLFGGAQPAFTNVQNLFSNTVVTGNANRYENKSKSITRQFTPSINIQRQPTKNVNAIKNVSASKNIQNNVQNTIIKNIQASTNINVQRNTQRQRNITANSPVQKNFSPFIGFNNTGVKKKKKEKQENFFRPFAYTPTLVGFELPVRFGKLPSARTDSLEIRPVVLPKRFKAFKRSRLLV